MLRHVARRLPASRLPGCRAAASWPAGARLHTPVAQTAHTRLPFGRNPLPQPGAAANAARFLKTSAAAARPDAAGAVLIEYSEGEPAAVSRLRLPRPAAAAAPSPHGLSPADTLEALRAKGEAQAARPALQTFAAVRPAQHGLSSNKTALITSDCGEARSPTIKWP